MHFFPYAHAAAHVPTQGGTTQLLLFLCTFGCIFYFMIYRPQASRAKAHRKLLSSITKGDEILTSSGLMGQIVQIFEENDCLLLALNTNLEIVVKKAFVSEILPKGTLKSLCCVSPRG